MKNKFYEVVNSANQHNIHLMKFAIISYRFLSYNDIHINTLYSQYNSTIVKEIKKFIYTHISDDYKAGSHKSR